jgi:putative glutamine amidotransferase
MITLDTCELERRGVAFSGLQLKQAYGHAVAKAGGLPLHVGPCEEQSLIAALLDEMDGLVVTGGDFDIPPEFYGETHNPTRRIDPPKIERTQFEAHLIRGALERKIPILGVCGGMQLLGVILGGRLIQDIGSEVNEPLEHEQASSAATPDHAVFLADNCPLTLELGRGEIQVNSTHHQALCDLPDDWWVDGRSEDGVIELVRHRVYPWAIGVQWHPELLDDDVSDKLYSALIVASTAYRSTKFG